METEVYYKLTDIRTRWGERILGQICQDLLALSFVRIGCKPESISVHNIEGIDIVIDDMDFGRYAIEVKTTSNDEVRLENKDYEGLRRYQQNNYKTILAVLKIELFKDWILADGSRFTGFCSLQVNGLYTPEEYKDIAQRINKAFEELVKTYGNGILYGGQEYLKEMLRKEGIKYSGE